MRKRQVQQQMLGGQNKIEERSSAGEMGDRVRIAPRSSYHHACYHHVDITRQTMISARKKRGGGAHPNDDGRPLSHETSPFDRRRPRRLPSVSAPERVHAHFCIHHCPYRCAYLCLCMCTCVQMCMSMRMRNPRAYAYGHDIPTMQMHACTDAHTYNLYACARMQRRTYMRVHILFIAQKFVQGTNS